MINALTSMTALDDDNLGVTDDNGIPPTIIPVMLIPWSVGRLGMVVIGVYRTFLETPALPKVRWPTELVEGGRQ